MIKLFVRIVITAFCLTHLMCCSMVQASRPMDIPITVDRLNVIPPTAKTCAVDERLPNSEIISHLSNAIYYLTALILTITVVAIVLPIIMVIFDKKKSEVREQIENSEKKLSEELKRGVEHNVRDAIEILKKDVTQDIQGNFINIVTKTLNNRIDDQMRYYNDSLEWQVREQSIEYEGCLYFMEKVREDLLKSTPLNEQSTLNDFYQWIMNAQKDYLMLLTLTFSGNKTEEQSTEYSAYTALGYFEGKPNLPESFLELLHFLKKHKRLSIENLTLANQIISRKKFHKD